MHCPRIIGAGAALTLLFSTTITAHAADDCDPCGYPPAVTVDALYTADLWRNASGGVATGNRYLDNVDLTLAIDGNRAFGLEGLQLFAYALYNNGHVLSDDLIGAAQGVSNIESTREARIYELWVDWELSPGPEQSSSLRFGLYDLNSEFDAIDTASLFINPSHGIGVDFSQSGENGPSIFPVTSVAVRAMTTRGPWTVQAAVLDGVPGDENDPDHSAIHFDEEEGLLLVSEVSYALESGLRAGGGYWHYTADFDDMLAVDANGDPAQRDDNSGFYLIAESPLLFAKDDANGWRFFARFGRVEDRINAIRRYTGVGGVYTGLFSSDDQFGIALAVATLGAPYRSVQEADDVATHEHIWELTYRVAVTDWLTLQPDVQYVRNAGMTPGVDPAWIVGLRFEVSQGWSR